MLIVGAVWLLATAPAPANSVAPGGADPLHSEEAIRRYAQGTLLEARGDVEQALGEYYRALLADPRAAHVARRVSELSARIGETQRSLEFAERSLELEPGNAHGLWLKGAALFNLGRVHESLPLLEGAVAADSGRVEYLRTLARVAEPLGRVDLVAWASERCVRLDEEDGESWFQLAAARARLGEFEAAERAIERSIEINPLRPGTLFLQAWIHEGQGRPEQAIQLYRQHLDIHEDDLVTRRRLVNLLSREDRYEEAYQEAKRVSAVTPNDREALEVEADLAFRSKHASEGVKLLDKLVQQSQAEPEAMMRALALMARNGRGKAAVVEADRWAAAHPGDVRGSMMAARVRALTGDHSAAIARAKEAIVAFPDSASPRALHARLLQEAGRTAEAEQAWTESALRFPQHVGMRLDLALCREKLGDFAGSQQAAREALRLQPDDPVVMNFVGYLFADQAQHLEEAEGLIRRALDKDPDNGAYVDSMGWVYYRLGRLGDARRELERAVRLTGGDPVVHEHLGDVYKDLKLMDLAKEQYRLSLAGDTVNVRVKAKLAEIR